MAAGKKRHAPFGAAYKGKNAEQTHYGDTPLLPHDPAPSFFRALTVK